MTKFLKLTNMILNPRNISQIVINPGKYFIHFMDKPVDGFMWVISGFGIGNITSVYSVLEVCSEKHKTDYDTLSEWISKNH